MKNVYFITPTDSIGASSRYRVYQYLPYLKNKINYKVYPFMSNKDYIRFKSNKKKVLLFKVPLLYLKRIKLLFMIKKNDIVFVHRDICPFGPMIIEKLLKIKGCKIILDIDDAVYCNETKEISNSNNKFLYYLKYGKRFDVAIKNADLVICGNRYIKDHCNKYNPNTIIIPTTIDTNKIKAVTRNKIDKDITIGWIGNPGNTKYVLNVLSDINKFFKDTKTKCNIILIGADNTFDKSKYDSLNIIIKKWSLTTEYNELSKCDFGIMPLNNTDWSKGKCGLKILQYFAIGIPALASDTGVNSEIVEDNTNGYLVKNNNWYEGVKHMISNKNKWVKWGINGRSKVERKYSINVWIDELVNQLENSNCKNGE